MKIEVALVFENPEANTSLQIEKDTDGYSMTIFDDDGSVSTMVLDRASMVRLTNFLNEELSQ